jgi:hypothetical protein
MACCQMSPGQIPIKLETGSRKDEIGPPLSPHDIPMIAKLSCTNQGSYAGPAELGS